jgi:hypothetical protein
MATTEFTPKALATITLPAPITFDEILLLLKPRLPQTSSNMASLAIWRFYADLLEAYTPELLEKIRQWNAGYAAALDAGENAVAGLRQAIEVWRCALAAPEFRVKVIVAGYDEVLQAFAQAHGEAFHEEAGGFEDDFKAWKQEA